MYSSIGWYLAAPASRRRAVVSTDRAREIAPYIERRVEFAPHRVGVGCGGIDPTR